MRDSTTDWLAAGLTRREADVARLVAQGLRNREVAERLCLTEKTVKNHMHRILDKLGATTRTQMAAWATTGAAQPDGWSE